MTKAEQWLLNNTPRLGCALYSFKHGKDKDYFKKAIQTDSLILKCDSFGEENPDKNIYMITIGNKNNGFFAEYHMLLKYLYYADRFHMTPVVRFTRDFLYSEDHAVNGSNNPFEYYFEQPGGVSVESAEKSRNVFRAEYIHTQIPDILDNKTNDYEVSDEYIGMLGEIAKRYIKLNPTVKKETNDSSIKLGIDEKTIGVHYRGTDFKRGLNNHPQMTSIEEYENATEALIQKGNYEKVFLATDSKEALERFRDRFSDALLCFENNNRSDSDVSVAFSKSERKDHHYLLGLEVLNDMMALSRCGALVAGLSQVSLAARITNETHENRYRDTRIISKGVSSNGADSTGYYREYGV